MGLSFKEYQDMAKNTAVYREAFERVDPNVRGPIKDRLAMMYLACGLTGESGEVAEKVKKWVRGDGETIQTDLFMKELGDVLWYLSMMCNEMGISLEEVAAMNLDKLAARKQNDAIRGSGDNR